MQFPLGALGRNDADVDWILGNAVTLFGAMNDFHRSFTIALDGGPPQTFSGRSLQYNAQQILVRPFCSCFPMSSLTLVMPF